MPEANISAEGDAMDGENRVEPMIAKKCPFRVDENGDFKDCLGAECMAFYEHTEKVLTPDPLNPYCYSVEKTVKKIRCLRCTAPTEKSEE